MQGTNRSGLGVSISLDTISSYAPFSVTFHQDSNLPAEVSGPEMKASAQTCVTCCWALGKALPVPPSQALDPHSDQLPPAQA